MKTLVVCLVMALAAAAGAEQISSANDPGARHAVTVTTNLSSGSLVWTNSLDPLITLRSAWIGLGAAQTSACGVSVVRRYDADYQRVGSLVETNEFGDIRTNYYSQVTNVTVAVFSNNMVATTSTNVAMLFSINSADAARRLPEDLYSVRGDVWYFWGGTTNEAITFSFTE